MKKVEIRVSWADVGVSLLLTEKEWEQILAGEGFSKDGDGYFAEGGDFLDRWSFKGGLEGELSVTYNDGGVGYEGKLLSDRVKITKFE